MTSLPDRMAATTDESLPPATRALDYIVAFRVFATVGALLAAVAPAVMATADGEILRGSVSAYWDVDPRYWFWAPFTAGAVLLAIDGVLSFVSPNRREYGERWYNIALGAALLLLTWFDLDNDPGVHYPAAIVFFALFIVVIVVSTALGFFGQRVVPPEPGEQETERNTTEVSGVFVLLLALTGAAYLLDLVSFFFFEVFALLNFALYYVQGLVNPFPYTQYRFPAGWLNLLPRLLGMGGRPVP